VLLAWLCATVQNGTHRVFRVAKAACMRRRELHTVSPGHNAHSVHIGVRLLKLRNSETVLGVIPKAGHRHYQVLAHLNLELKYNSQS